MNPELGNGKGLTTTYHKNDRNYPELKVFTLDYMPLLEGGYMSFVPSKCFVCLLSFLLLCILCPLSLLLCIFLPILFSLVLFHVGNIELRRSKTTSHHPSPRDNDHLMFTSKIPHFPNKLFKVLFEMVELVSQIVLLENMESNC